MISFEIGNDQMIRLKNNSGFDHIGPEDLRLD